ncbi:MAG TPA: ASPIC/UnbV domain-containing protein [Planctomycetota bacterium]|nr:ASPIC/UnbV domain-containing protein [Planctomycetota bacterium]
MNNYNGEAEYFVNEAARGHWLRVRLRGRESNRDGIGAVIRLRAGGQKQMRVITAGDGYASQFSRVAHCGLGPAPAADIEITWPSGVKQAFRGVAADRVLEIDEGSETMGVVHVDDLRHSDRR